MTNSITLHPATGLSIDALAELFNRSFEGYFVPLKLDARALAALVRRDGIDLSASRVARVDGQDVGLALIAVRGQRWRVAAMGTVVGQRRTGVGRAVMASALAEARQARAARLELEVITKNEAAIALYESVGLRRMCRLVGFELSLEAAAGDASGDSASGAGLTAVDAVEVGRAVAQHGAVDLPWQLSAENVASFGPPAVAYRFGAGRGWCLLSDPQQRVVSVLSLVVAGEARRRGTAREFLAALSARHPERAWRVPPIVPEGPLTEALARLGGRRAELGQWRMSVARGPGSEDA